VRSDNSGLLGFERLGDRLVTRGKEVNSTRPLAFRGKQKAIETRHPGASACSATHLPSDGLLAQRTV
jgi:hypothetical protein